MKADKIVTSKQKGKRDTKPAKPTRKSSSWRVSRSMLFSLAVIGAVVAYLFYYRNSGSEVSTRSNEIRTVSIVMVGHNENPYLQRTFDSIMKSAPLKYLKEIIYVDDGSEPPARDVLDTMNNPLIKIVRNDERQGLIRARMQGADASSSDLLVFLDAHIRAYPGWLEPMLQNANANYKRITFPLIPVLDEKTWEPVGKLAGINMVFDWKLDFIWLPESEEMRVPTMSGGLLGITRKWYYESGEYDEGMKLWGGENVEQSMRTWLCGGEIIRSPKSVIAHMFRPKAPYEPNVPQIHMNKVRAVEVWFDDYAGYYYRANPFDKDRRPSPESIADRIALKEKLGCKPFQHFVDLFRDILEANEILPKFTFHIREVTTGTCLAVNGGSNKTLVSLPCDPLSPEQVFIPDSWKRIRNGKFKNDCLSGDPLNGKHVVHAEQCSAHIPAEKDWLIDETTGVITKSGNFCLTKGQPAELRPCAAGTESRFEKMWIKPYDHDMYK